MNYPDDINSDAVVRFKLNEVKELASMAIRNLCAAGLVDAEVRKTAVIVLHALVVRGQSFSTRTFRKLCFDAERFDHRIDGHDYGYAFVSPYQRERLDGDYYKALFVRKEGTSSATAAPARVKVRDRAAKAIKTSMEEFGLSPDIALRYAKHTKHDENFRVMVDQLMMVLFTITGLVYVHPAKLGLDRNSQKRYQRKATKFAESLDQVELTKPRPNLASVRANVKERSELADTRYELKTAKKKISALTDELEKLKERNELLEDKNSNFLFAISEVRADFARNQRLMEIITYRED